MFNSKEFLTPLDIPVSRFITIPLPLLPLIWRLGRAAGKVGLFWYRSNYGRMRFLTPPMAWDRNSNWALLFTDATAAPLIKLLIWIKLILIYNRTVWTNLHVVLYCLVFKFNVQVNDWSFIVREPSRHGVITGLRAAGADSWRHVARGSSVLGSRRCWRTVPSPWHADTSSGCWSVPTASRPRATLVRRPPVDEATACSPAVRRSSPSPSTSSPPPLHNAQWLSTIVPSFLLSSDSHLLENNYSLLDWVRE